METESSILDSKWIEKFGYPVTGYEGSDAESVGGIIGTGYAAFEHPREQEQYRAISRTCKSILGETLDRDDSRLAIYFGSVDRPANSAIGWEAARLSAKSGGRIGLAREVGFPKERPYDFIIHAPYVTDGDHPLFLAATLDSSLTEDGSLILMGPRDLSGREEILELPKAQALETLTDKRIGRDMVRLNRAPEFGEIPGKPAVGTGRKYTDAQKAAFQSPRFWRWHELRNGLAERYRPSAK